VRVLGYWLVRAALFLCVAVALYAVGWRNESAAIGAVLLSWMIAYMLFGSQHDHISEWIETRVDEWKLRRAEGKGSKG
jgi:hypothetical protein